MYVQHHANSAMDCGPEHLVKYIYVYIYIYIANVFTVLVGML